MPVQQPGEAGLLDGEPALTTNRPHRRAPTRRRSSPDQRRDRGSNGQFSVGQSAARLPARVRDVLTCMFCLEGARFCSRLCIANAASGAMRVYVPCRSLDQGLGASDQKPPQPASAVTPAWVCTPYAPRPALGDIKTAHLVDFALGNIMSCSFGTIHDCQLTVS